MFSVQWRVFWREQEVVEEMSEISQVIPEKFLRMNRCLYVDKETSGHLVLVKQGMCGRGDNRKSEL